MIYDVHHFFSWESAFSFDDYYTLGRYSKMTSDFSPVCFDDIYLLDDDVLYDVP